MSDQDLKWSSFLPLALLAGLVAVLLDALAIWPSVFRPDLLWCLAYFAFRRAPPLAALTVAAWAGLARDLFLGPKLGSATLSYLLAAIFFLVLIRQVSGSGLFEHALLFASLTLLATLLKTALDPGGPFAHDEWGEGFLVALGRALASTVCYPVIYPLWSWSAINPTRPRRRPLA